MESGASEGAVVSTPDCKCTATEVMDYRNNPPTTMHVVEHCPLHLAALAMYKALEAAQEALSNEWLYQTGQFHRPAALYPPQGSVHGSVGDAMAVITTALRDARGEGVSS